MKKNKALQYIIQVIVWGIVFGFPLFFAWKEAEAMTWVRYLGYVFVPVTFAIIFYSNYFILIDKILFRKRLIQFLLANLVLCVPPSCVMDRWRVHYLIHI